MNPASADHKIALPGKGTCLPLLGRLTTRWSRPGQRCDL
jgi:hypothetical protein